MTMNLGCLLLGMNMKQALVAATINAAGNSNILIQIIVIASIHRADTHGSLEPGKSGDCVVINSPRWEHLVRPNVQFTYLTFKDLRNGRSSSWPGVQEGKTGMAKEVKKEQLI